MSFLLGQYLSDILQVLPAVRRVEFASLVHEARGDNRARVRLIKFLVRNLPADHPVRRAIASDDATLGAPAAAADLDAELERLEALLAAMPPTPEEIIESAHARLRSLPALASAPVGDNPPPVTDIIVLDDRIPSFQYAEDGTPLPAVVRVNRVLRPDLDPWAAADWWTGPNIWLGMAPVELLHGPREGDILAAALVLGED